MSTLETQRTALPTGTWASDPTHSTIDFTVKHMLVGKFRASVPTFSATLVVDGDGSRLEGTAAVASIVAADENLTGHLQSPDFFDAERYPEISFRADQLTLAEDGSVTGSAQLTIKGVTKPVELKGRLASAPSVDPFGRERLGLTLETAIDRNEFGVAWNAPNQSGGNYLGDEVTLTADLTFVRQES
jgi:polyisoprenoid-binding protein YceI